MMRKLLWVFCLTVILAFAVVLPASAQPSVIVDGKALSFDVPPVIQDGRTLVPLRAIFEALGATLDWDETTQTVTATKGPLVIRLTIGDSTAYRGDTAVILDVPGLILAGRTMVQVRFISESLGGRADWIAESGRVEITSEAVIADDIVPATLGDSADPRIEKAVAWARGMLGRTYGAGEDFTKGGYYYCCLAFVQHAYTLTGAQGNLGPFGTAKNAARILDAQANKDRTPPPAGAWVFYAWEPDGHVALSIGNGKVIHSMTYLGRKTAEIRQDPYDQISGVTYIGWVMPDLVPPLVLVPLPLPFPEGEWVLLTQLAENVRVAVTGLVEGGTTVRLRHPDGTMIELFQLDQGYYQTARSGVALKVILEGGRWLVNLDGLRAVGWLDGAGYWLEPVIIPAPRPIGAYVPLQQLVDDLGIVVTPFPERHSVQLRHPDGTTVELTRADRGLSVTYKNIWLQMIIQDGHFLVHHYGFGRLGWLDSPPPSPLPDGDWIGVRELAENYRLGVASEGDGIRLHHPDGTSIRFSRTAQGYEAVYQGKTLRMIIGDSGTLVDRSGLREIGWL